MGIRVLEKTDLEFAASLTAEEGWFYTPRELELMLRLDPEGSFVFDDGERLGFVTSVTYGKTGVLGHLVVSKKGRGKKIGETLLTAALDYMTARGTESILIYSTEEGMRLYRRHGFAPSMEIHCAHLELRDHRQHRIAPDCRPIDKTDLEEIARIDLDLFGDDRSDLLRALREEGPKHSFKMERNGQIVGFALARHDHIGYDLGPWVCTSGRPEDAEALFQSVLSTLDDGSTIYMGSFYGNEAALRIMDKLPKIRSWRIPLMVRGRPRYDGDLTKTYGIAAFELG